MRGPNPVSPLFLARGPRTTDRGWRPPLVAATRVRNPERKRGPASKTGKPYPASLSFCREPVDVVHAGLYRGATGPQS